jgi:hypothetical protein
MLVLGLVGIQAFFSSRGIMRSSQFVFSSHLCQSRMIKH